MSISDIAMVVDADVKRVKDEQLNDWRIARYLAYIDLINNPYAKPQHKPRKPEDLFKLEGDPKPREVNIRKVKIRHEQIIKAWMN